MKFLEIIDRLSKNHRVLIPLNRINYLEICNEDEWLIKIFLINKIIFTEYFDKDEDAAQQRYSAILRRFLD